jgi:hypothetical protein
VALAAPAPGGSDARVEVDVGLVLKEHLDAALLMFQHTPNRPHSLLFPWVGDVQRRPRAAPHPLELGQGAAHRRGVNPHLRAR